MLKLLTLTAIILALSCNANAQVCPDSIFGVNSDGFKKLGGATIGEVDGKRYAIEHLCNGRFHKLLLQVDEWPTEGSPRWKTIDVLQIPVGPRDFELVYGESSYLKLNGVLDPELVSLAIVTAADYWYSSKAWRADRRKGKFQILRKIKIQCENPGYGV